MHDSWMVHILKSYSTIKDERNDYLKKGGVGWEGVGGRKEEGI